MMKSGFLAVFAASSALGVLGLGLGHAEVAQPVTQAVIEAQRAALSANSVAAGFGPQSPRDLRNRAGENERLFSFAPDARAMNLCNIHVHAGAEHAGGAFTTFLGHGDGAGYGTGFGYDGVLSAAELAPFPAPVGTGEHGLLQPGDTIEVHFVHSSAQVIPGPGLGACLSETVQNPQLRVETQVMVLVNDPGARDFQRLAHAEMRNGYWQAPNVPTDTGTPIVYHGSTTGPDYNEIASPLQVTWSVRPDVVKVDIASVARWYDDNIFAEEHAHGVRNLVTDPRLLAPIAP